ncbi:MAG: hypothetical protein N4A41_04145 [Crocinitomicaceae bacterium]|jgi:tetratricopeptide (TPR) repeat protein|nr:hypothetical protein [Crocinitomicaceae bacterium]
MTTPSKLNVLLKVFLFSICTINFTLHAQTNYENAWKALDNAELDKAISLFEKAKKDADHPSDAMLCLALLHAQHGRVAEGEKNMDEYLKTAKDPLPGLYAAWTEACVSGRAGKQNATSLARFQKLSTDPRFKGNMESGIKYVLLVNDEMSFKTDLSKWTNQLKPVMNWSYVGPFDNVMNNAFDKDFGAVAHADAKHNFTARYGTNIHWFDPKLESVDAYNYLGAYFKESSALFYGQSFVELPADQEVILNFSYSAGAAKLWVDDSLLYSLEETREYEMDYHQYKLKLGKGTHRILVQLGNYDYSAPAFIVRFTDKDYNTLDLKNSAFASTYTKGLKSVEPIKFAPVKSLEAWEATSEDPLAKYMLALANIRVSNFDEAERLLLELEENHAKNYFVQRSLIVLYNKKDAGTKQNEQYELFKETYPKNIDILENEIRDNQQQDNKSKVKELIEEYLRLYPNPFKEADYNIITLGYDQKGPQILKIIEDMYKKYPEDYDCAVRYYNLLKNYYKDPAKAKKVLEKYLKTNYSSSILNELAGIYLEEGKMSKAVDIVKKGLLISPTYISSHKVIYGLMTRQGNYQGALNYVSDLLISRPTDYSLLDEKAELFAMMDNTDSAKVYYQLSLNHFPFSFSTNELLRELNNKKVMFDQVRKIEPADIIAAYEKEMGKAEGKTSFDIVYDNQTDIIYKSNAQGAAYSYIIRMNDEKALERWQSVSIGGGYAYETNLIEAKTIKANGNKIQAETSGGSIVFTNLAVGDYIYVSYTQGQRSGGKSSKFISNQFSLDSYNQVYKSSYELFLENGLEINDTILNSQLVPTIVEVDGFQHYVWELSKPKMLKEEVNVTSFGDISQRVHIGLKHEWKDVVQWYSDLSSSQAVSDYTIKKTVKELFEDGKTYTNMEKFRKIYNYIGENIVYSSIDFRQSNFIPQKASDVIQTKLGDCKDVSTLFVALAREAGLKANLVLIATTNNGLNPIILPSLDFNHCIVKIYDGANTYFLELTDPDLPFGHLGPVHMYAPILEIPAVVENKDYKLERLTWNKGFNSMIERKTKVNIKENGGLAITSDVNKIGFSAAGFVGSYYYSNDTERKNDLKDAISGDFNSQVSVSSFDFSKLKPRLDTASYTYNYTVENEVLKLGTMRSLRVRFADNLVSMNIFEDEERQFPFDNIFYERNNSYNEQITLKLEGNHAFKDIPSDMKFTFKNSSYEMKFKKISDSEVQVTRIFVAYKDNVKPEDFQSFRDYMSKVNEAENTHLLFN